ncbi:MAG: transcription antitermination factor NusB [Verrucomicrobiales bacterium]|nr:transcription antitermination factor NusB [Verrucomicrobiales bacterium]
MDSSGKSDKKSKKKAPSPRRDGREAAVQYLYGNDISGEVDFSPERIAEFWEIRLAKSFAQDFTAELLTGIEEHLPEIDRSIRERLENFAFERLTAVDRNILRLGAFEILFADHIPPQAAINESIEIAKRFGTEESPKFINGILDKILKS